MGQSVKNMGDLSGPERGEVNLAKVRTYLEGLRESGQGLPMEGRRPNITAISEASGVLRNAFYTNKGIRKLLREFLGSDIPDAAGENDSSTYYKEQIELRDRRILQLEQQLAASQAETHELRQRLAASEQRLEYYQILEDQVVKAGRRIIP